MKLTAQDSSMLKRQLAITPINAFADNYIWVISDKHLSAAYVVDPGHAQGVIHHLEQQSLELLGILITHRHYDHIDGINDLKQHFPNAIVYGPNSQHIPQVEQSLSEGSHMTLFNTYSLDILDVPGHTNEHIAYLLNTSTPALFCGDTLFAGGCGRCFDGDIENFEKSINKISKLDDKTEIFCAHEYTIANLQFAIQIEPDNPHIHTRLQIAQQLRQQQQPTLPSQLAYEKQTNPFLRTHIESIQQLVSKQPGRSTFAKLRYIKDHFNG